MAGSKLKEFISGGKPDLVVKGLNHFDESSL